MFDRLERLIKYNPFGIFGGGGGGDDSATRAAEIEAEANREAIAEQRRQFEITQGIVQPFVQAGVGALPEFQAGTTVGGLEQRLSDIFSTQTFGSLVGERQDIIQNQLAAGGLTRSGAGLQQIAEIPATVGFDISNVLQSGLGDLIGGGRQAALGLGDIGLRTSSAISDIQRDTGRALGQGILVDRQADVAQEQFRTAALLSALGIAAQFSDPRLKENVEVIGKIVDLNIHEWDWIEKAKGTIIEQCSNMGFLSTEVREKYPHHVYEFCGFDVIDIPNLLNELEAKI